MKKFTIQAQVDGAIFIRPNVGIESDMLKVKKGSDIVLDEAKKSEYHFAIQILEKSGKIKVVEEGKKEKITKVIEKETEVDLSKKAESVSEPEKLASDSSANKAVIMEKKVEIKKLQAEYDVAPTRDAKKVLKEKILGLKKEMHALK